jgi:hypothetical protein
LFPRRYGGAFPLRRCHHDLRVGDTYCERHRHNRGGLLWMALLEAALRPDWEARMVEAARRFDAEHERLTRSVR